MLEEAEDPATMAVELKELMEDWITTLEMENTMPWNPAGRPTWAMRFTVRLSRPSCFRSSRSRPLSRSRQTATSTAERYWEMMVARATPATLRWQTMTKNRFSTALRMPAAVRKYRGRWVSPWARRMAAPKL